MITGLRQKQLDEEVIFTEFMRKNPDASAESQLVEKPDYKELMLSLQ